MVSDEQIGAAFKTLLAATIERRCSVANWSFRRKVGNDLEECRLVLAIGNERSDMLQVFLQAAAEEGFIKIDQVDYPEGK